MDQLIHRLTDEVKQKLLKQGMKLSESPKVQSMKMTIINHMKAKDITPNTLAPYIDHTLLKPDASLQELEKICKEALQHGFAAVCVNSSNISFAAKMLNGSQVLPIAVVGFPLGAATTSAKAFEAKEAILAGAKEIDMVINIGALKDAQYILVLEDMKKVVENASPYPVKVILETSLLTQEQKIIACALAKIAGAKFVKTSTGFSTGGATVEDVKLMRSIVGKDMGVKASGGIRTFKEAAAMIEAGADRIGTSHSVALVTGKTGRYGY